MTPDIYIYIGPNITDALARIETLLMQLTAKETVLMALSDDILSKIAAQNTLIGSIKTYIQSLIGNTIPADVAQAILTHLDENSAALTSALPANVPPAPLP